jgi:hypothetical protein
VQVDAVGAYLAELSNGHRGFENGPRRQPERIGATIPDGPQPNVNLSAGVGVKLLIGESPPVRLDVPLAGTGAARNAGSAGVETPTC